MFYVANGYSITHFAGRGKLQDLCPATPLEASDSPAESTAECTVLDTNENKRGYKEIKTEPVPGLLLNLPEVLLSIIGMQGEEAATCKVSIAQSAALDAEVI